MIPIAARLIPALLFVAFQQTIRVDVSLVTVGVQVMDSRGRDVRGLKADDFQLAQDGVPQKIASFSSEAQPITLGIILDSSSSMEANQKIDRAKEAAQALVQGARDGSEFFYIEFNEKVRIAADSTSDRQAVVSAIRRTTAEGSTSLYDAILEGVALSGRAQLPRQALVVISDGADQHSTHELAEIIDIVRESGLQIYTIGYFSAEEERISRSSAKKLPLSNGAEVDNPRLALLRIAEESGAVAFFPRSDAELARAVTQINNDLATQYSFGFYPPGGELDSGYHRLSVTVKGNGYKVRARPGYGTRQFTPGTVRPKLETSRAYEANVERRNGVRIYRDDFKDSTSGWPQSETAQYTQAGYRLAGEQRIVSAGAEFQNFRATVTLSVPEQLPPSDPFPRVGTRSLPTTGMPENPLGAGMVFRQTDAGYYAFVVYPRNLLHAGFALVVRGDSGKASELVRWPLLDRPSRDRKIEVHCEGNDCAFSEGGALLGRLKNIAADEGRVGLILNARGEALFQDLTVEEISATAR
jgi:Ca-activated chloride channel family protein